ncbi:unnamed protein product [Closterium sp. NIES-54]
MAFHALRTLFFSSYPFHFVTLPPRYSSSLPLFSNTRTCIHTPGSPPLLPSELSAAAITSLLSGASLAYFDGRLADTTIRICQQAVALGLPVLVDAEKPREGLDDLLAHATFVVVSEKFPQVSLGETSFGSGRRWAARSYREETLGAALLAMAVRLPKAQFIIVTLGAAGCAMLDRRVAAASDAPSEDVDRALQWVIRAAKEKGSKQGDPAVFSSRPLRLKSSAQGTEVAAQLVAATAVLLEAGQVVDTTGAGDAFIGAVLYGELGCLMYDGSTLYLCESTLYLCESTLFLCESTLYLCESTLFLCESTLYLCESTLYLCESTLFLCESTLFLCESTLYLCESTLYLCESTLFLCESTLYLCESTLFLCESTLYLCESTLYLCESTLFLCESTLFLCESTLFLCESTLYLCESTLYLCESALSISSTLYLCESALYLCESRLYLCESTLYPCESTLYLCESTLYLCESSLYLCESTLYLCESALYLCESTLYLCDSTLYLRESALCLCESALCLCESTLCLCESTLYLCESTLYLSISAGFTVDRMLALGATIAAAKCQALGARQGLPRRDDPRLAHLLEPERAVASGFIIAINGQKIASTNQSRVILVPPLLKLFLQFFSETAVTITITDTINTISTISTIRAIIAIIAPTGSTCGMGCVEDAAGDGAICQSRVPRRQPRWLLLPQGDGHWRQQVANLLPHMLKIRGLSAASAVLITGCSAGGQGVAVSCDWMASRLPSATTVKCAIDAGYFLDEPDLVGHFSFRGMMQRMMVSQWSDASFDPQCVKAYPHTEKWRCIFPTNALQHTQTPVLVLNSAFDLAALAIGLTRGNVEAMTGSYESVVPCYRSDRFLSCPRRIRKYVGHHAIVLRNSLQALVKNRQAAGVQSTAVVPNKTSHCTMAYDNWSVPDASGVRLRDMVAAWFFGKQL